MRRIWIIYILEMGNGGGGRRQWQWIPLCDLYIKPAAVDVGTHKGYVSSVGAGCWVGLSLRACCQAEGMLSLRTHVRIFVSWVPWAPGPPGPFFSLWALAHPGAAVQINLQDYTPNSNPTHILLILHTHAHTPHTRTRTQDYAAEGKWQEPPWLAAAEPQGDRDKGGEDRQGRTGSQGWKGRRRGQSQGEEGKGRERGGSYGASTTSSSTVFME